MKFWNIKFNSLIALSALLISQPTDFAWADGPNPLQPFEQGPNDFLASNAGKPGTGAQAQATMPAISYDDNGKRFLNIWRADDNISILADNEFEIFGQFTEQDGILNGGVKRLTQVGPENDPNFIANAPDVATNPFETLAEASYMLVYEATDENKGGVGVFDIFAQKLNVFGNPATTTPLRVSDMDDFVATDTTSTPPSDRAAQDPAIAFNPGNTVFANDQEYLVVWSGRRNGKFDIYGQLLDKDGNSIGNDDFRISTTALAGNISTNPNFNASKPRAVFNTERKEYLVVWSQDTEGLTDNEFEIWGRRLSATGQSLTAPFRISSMGPIGNPNFEALCPDVAYNPNDSLSGGITDPDNDEYLVVWSGEAQDEDFEIYGQRLDALGNQIGTDDFRISDMGPDAPNPLSNEFPATDPAVECNPIAGTYYVVWAGEDDRAPLVNDEREIFAQLLDENGNEIPNNDVRISDMGPNGNIAASASAPAIAFSPKGLFVVSWSGDDIDQKNGFGEKIVAGELEIHNQFVLAKEGLLQINTNQISASNPQDICLTFKLTPPDASGEPDLNGPGPGDKTLSYFLGFGTKTSPETTFQPVPPLPNLPNNGIVRLPINNPLNPFDAGDPLSLYGVLTSLSNITGTSNIGTIGPLQANFSITIRLSVIPSEILNVFKGVTFSFAALSFQSEIPPVVQQPTFVPDPETTTNAVSFTIVD